MNIGGVLYNGEVQPGQEVPKEEGNQEENYGVDAVSGSLQCYKCGGFGKYIAENM